MPHEHRRNGKEKKTTAKKRLLGLCCTMPQYLCVTNNCCGFATRYIRGGRLTSFQERWPFRNTTSNEIDKFWLCVHLLFTQNRTTRHTARYSRERCRRRRRRINECRQQLFPFFFYILQTFTILIDRKTVMMRVHLDAKRNRKKKLRTTTCV